MPAPARPDQRGALQRATAPPDLPQLWSQVVLARRAVAVERHEALTSARGHARDSLLDALQAYVSRLEEAGLPIPYTLRDEVRLMRLTRSADRGY